jgi:hypothetical protein
VGAVDEVVFVDVCDTPASAGSTAAPAVVRLPVTRSVRFVSAPADDRALVRDNGERQPEPLKSRRQIHMQPP